MIPLNVALLSEAARDRLTALPVVGMRHCHAEFRNTILASIRKEVILINLAQQQKPVKGILQKRALGDSG